jgi:DNA polymerase-3 subunit delta'
MNNNAANSLLKTLEEPTDKLLFLLVTHKPQQLLPTILSRCLSFSVHTPTLEVGSAWLAQQGVKNPEHALAQTGFAPLQALDWAESGEGAEERSILLSAIRQPATMDALVLADSLQRSAPVYVIHCLQQWCHDLASAKLAGTVRFSSAKSKAISGIPVIGLPPVVCCLISIHVYRFALPPEFPRSGKQPGFHSRQYACQ